MFAILAIRYCELMNNDEMIKCLAALNRRKESSEEVRRLAVHILDILYIHTPFW